MNRFVGYLAGSLVFGGVLFGGVLFGAGSSVGGANLTFTARTPMDADGWGPFRIGQTVGSAEKRWGKQVVHSGHEDFDGFCWYISPFGEGTPFVMVNADAKGDPDAGIVVRIESSSTDTKRPIVVKGMRAGVSKASVLKLFPVAKRTPHEYTNGSYFDVTLKPNRVVRFVSGDDKAVDQIYLGDASAIQYVEGCA
jgi:hypothetical protein